MRRMALGAKKEKRGQESLSLLERAQTALAAGDLSSAEKLLRRTVAQQPMSATAFNTLGNVLRRKGDLRAAVETHQQATQLAPDSPKAWSDLGLAHLTGGDCARAADAFSAALRISPGHPELLYNLGTAQLHAGLADGAISHLERAVRAEPERAAALFNLGLAYKCAGRHLEALPLQRKALQLEPGNAEFEWGLSLTEIVSGELQAGFSHFEARRRLPGYPVFARGWSGTHTEEDVTIFAEQGLGDTLQFARFLRRAAARTRRLTLACQPELMPLMRHADLGAVDLRALEVGAPRPELGAPLMSLPHLLGLADGDLYAEPYLGANPELVRRFARELASGDERPLVGLCFQGNPQYRNDKARSMSLGELRPLLEMPELRFASLQKGFGQEQIAQLPEALRPLDLGAQLDNQGAAFYETAAALKAMHCLITTDSAIAHLAGGLGVPVMLMLPFDPDFRWGLSASRWYASMRVFRQARPGDWTAVVRAVMDGLWEGLLWMQRRAS